MLRGLATLLPALAQIQSHLTALHAAMAMLALKPIPVRVAPAQEAIQ